MEMKNRRDFLKQISAGLAASAFAPFGSILFSGSSARAESFWGTSFSKPRVAIIGGGIGGVASAWLMDQAAEVHIFEAGNRLGGHAMTKRFNYKGTEQVVDIGAQYFSPLSYPNYTRILEKVGLYSASNPANDQTIPVQATLTVFKDKNVHPLFIAPQSHGRIWPILDPKNFSGLKAFNVSLQHAKTLTAQGNWNVTLKEFLDSLPLTHHQKYDVLFPYLCAAVGCKTTEGMNLSALTVLFYVTEALSGGVIPSPAYCNSKIGLQGNVETIASRAQGLQVHLNASVVRIIPRGGKYQVIQKDGQAMDVDHVVLACPPNVAKELLLNIPDSDEQLNALQKFKTFDARIVIHTDAIYVPKRRRFWSAVNTQANPDHPESSMWFGAMRPKMADGSTLDIFKSWALSRSEESRAILHDQKFHHFQTPPSMVEGTHELARLQGKSGIWFAGAYTGGPVNHETATESALQVARGITPDAPNLRGF